MGYGRSTGWGLAENWQALGLDIRYGPGSTCLKRSKGRERLGVPVRKIALRLRLTADTAASVCLASGAFSLVRRVWLSSAMMIFQSLDAKQCCITTKGQAGRGARLGVGSGRHLEASRWCTVRGSRLRR